MADTYREVKRTTTPEREVEVVPMRSNGAAVATTVVSLIGGIIVTLLGLRFLLSLLGANSTNAFADFIYTVSRPFVAPFFSLFNYQPQIGTVRLEWETLIAMLFWAFLTWLIVRLIAMADRARTDV